MAGSQSRSGRYFAVRKDGTETLTNMLNKIRNGKEFPLDWEIAVIYPVYKGKGGREKPGNCRGISLLSINGKIFS
jgi:hypothetical protein